MNRYTFKNTISVIITSIYYQLLFMVHITQLILRKTMQPHINIQLIIQLLMKIQIIILLLAISLTVQSSAMHFRVLVCFLMSGPVQLSILPYLKVHVMLLEVLPMRTRLFDSNHCINFIYTHTRTMSLYSPD